MKRLIIKALLAQLVLLGSLGTLWAQQDTTQIRINRLRTILKSTSATGTNQNRLPISRKKLPRIVN